MLVISLSLVVVCVLLLVVVGDGGCHFVVVGVGVRVIVVGCGLRWYCGVWSSVVQLWGGTWHESWGGTWHACAGWSIWFITIMTSPFFRLMCWTSRACAHLHVPQLHLA